MSLWQTLEKHRFAIASGVWREHCCGGGGVSHQMRSVGRESSGCRRSSGRAGALRGGLRSLSSLAVMLPIVLGLAACAPKKAAGPVSPEVTALYPTLADNPKPPLVPY